MSVPSFRNSRSKVRRRRSHHALSKTQVNVCAKCRAAILPHHACKACGNYNNRQVAKTVEAVLDKKVGKAKEAKESKEASKAAKSSEKKEKTK